MIELKFPLQFTEIPLGYTEGFSFSIPEREFGRDDIKIWVEYFRKEDDPDTLHYGAWACVGNINLRTLVAQGDAPRLGDRNKQVDYIFSRINLSKEFFGTIAACVALLNDLATEVADSGED